MAHPITRAGGVARTVRSYTANTKSAGGVVTQGAPVERLVVCLPVGLSGAQRRILPSGQRSADGRGFLCESEIKAAKKGPSGWPADRIVYDGAEWEVVSAAPRTAPPGSGLGHWFAITIRVGSA